MLELGLLLTLQLTHGGSMADTLGLEDIRTAIRYTESLFPTSKGMLEPEVLRHLLENLASAPGASIGEKSNRVERGISFVTAPHVQFLPTGVVEFEDFLAVLSVTSATAARWVTFVRDLLWPSRSPPEDAAWRQLRQDILTRLGVRDPGG